LLSLAQFEEKKGQILELFNKDEPLQA